MAEQVTLATTVKTQSSPEQMSAQSRSRKASRPLLL